MTAGANTGFLMGGTSPHTYGTAGIFLPNDNGGGSDTGVSTSLQVTFNNDGTYTITNHGGGTVTGNWYSAAPSTGIGASYWVKVTPSSGAFTTNGASAFTQISTAPAAKRSATGGLSAAVIFKIEFSSASGGSPIVGTWNNWEFDLN